MFSLRAHNVLDYAVGVLLVMCPSLFGFATVTAATNTFLVVGYAMLIYTLLSHHRFAIFRAIPLSAHMFLDVTSGILLMLAPTVFDYRAEITNGQYALHFVMGIATLALVTFTRSRPFMLRHTLRADIPTGSGI